MTAEQLEELLGRVTPGPWNVSKPVDGAPEFRVIQHGEYGHSDCGRYFHTAGQTSADDAALVALAPSLARKVIAAEKIINAYTELLATVECECPSLLEPLSGGADVLCNLVMDADAALTAYRGASK